MKSGCVLVAGGDPGTQRQLASLLEEWGYGLMIAGSVLDAIAAVAHTRFVFSLVDAELARADTREFLRRLRLTNPDGDPGPIILLADPDTMTWSEEVPAAGADAILRKPIEPPKLEKAIQEVLSRPGHEGKPLRADEAGARLEQEIALWRSPKMQRVWEILQQAARVDVPVLIRGEMGTGKSLVARAIHHLSPRRDGPFVTVNCAAAPREVLESELFGHERGDPAGAGLVRAGKIESADHGTVFLDRVGDLPPALQAQLLRLLQVGEFSRVGGQSTVKVDFRIVASSTQDLERAVELGQFREDLYYRLNVIPIVVPPLRERAEEIPLLVNYFIERYSREFQREGFALPANVMARLLRHAYPGNVRELENFAKRMILLDDPGIASTPQFPMGEDETRGAASDAGQARVRSLKEISRAAARAAEREVIASMLQLTGWNRVKAAKLLKISYRALLYKIKEAGLKQGPSASTDRRDLGAGREDLHPPAA